MFAPELYFNRRQLLAKEVQKGIIILFGNSPAPLNFKGHQGRFRQDSSFLYYTGIDKPDLMCIIDCDTAVSTLYGNELTMDDLIWTGPQHELRHYANLSKIEKVKSWHEASTDIATHKRANKTIHFLPPYSATRNLQLLNLLQIPIAHQVQQASNQLIESVIRHRIRKDTLEIEQIENTFNTLTRPMFLKAFEMAKSGVKEQEIVAAMHYIVNTQGGKMAFPPICSVKGAVLQNETYQNRLQQGQLLLIDACAEGPMHYATDVTRTIPVNHKFTTAQKEIYQIVLEAQKSAIESIKPGLAYRDIHLLTAKKMVDGLKLLGIMQGDSDEIIARGAHALFFPHGLGHMMGLDVHDMEDIGEDYVGYGSQYNRSSQFGLSALRYARELMTDQVITVEPGLYFIPELMDIWKAEKRALQFINYSKLESFKAFGGIRIEDDVVVTQNGQRVIGEPIPKEISELEAL